MQGRNRIVAFGHFTPLTRHADHKKRSADSEMAVKRHLRNQNGNRGVADYSELLGATPGPRGARVENESPPKRHIQFKRGDGENEDGEREKGRGDERTQGGTEQFAKQLENNGGGERQNEEPGEEKNESNLVRNVGQ